MPKKVANPSNKTLSFSVDAASAERYAAYAKLQGVTLSRFLKSAVAGWCSHLQVEQYVQETYNKPKEPT
jgi:hypothetical protein